MIKHFIKIMKGFFCDTSLINQILLHINNATWKKTYINSSIFHDTGSALAKLNQMKTSKLSINVKL